VIPGLIRRFHEAKIKDEGLVKVWGTGEPLREFLYVDDLADACVLLMNLDKEIYKKNTKPMCSHINVGYGSDISIAGLSKLVASTVGYSGKVEFDSNYPDGVYKKLIDSSRIKALGWAPKTNLESGLRLAYEDFKAQSH
jgi:GDP-L-fucose synthase